MMSSATSTDPSSGPAGDATTQPDTSSSQAIEPWQFFLLFGMLAATAVVIAATGQSAASIIVLSLTVVSASFVAHAAYRTLVPLVRPDSIAIDIVPGGRTRAALEREKVLALRAIKELEFDFAMGKIVQADFDEVGARLRNRAMGLIRQLDDGQSYKTAIDQELARRLAALVPDLPPQAPAHDVAAGDISACAVCGASNDGDARFCKQCGTKLAADREAV